MLHSIECGNISWEGASSAHSSSWWSKLGDLLAANTTIHAIEYRAAHNESKSKNIGLSRIRYRMQTQRFVRCKTLDRWSGDHYFKVASFSEHRRLKRQCAVSLDALGVPLVRVLARSTRHAGSRPTHACALTPLLCRLLEALTIVLA